MIRAVTQHLLLTFAMALVAAPAFVAEASDALLEDWRHTDYGFSSQMLATGLNDDIYVLGDTAVGDYLVIKKFTAAGTLVWQTTYDPMERLRGVWIALDSNDNPVVLATIITGSSADPAGWLTLKYDANGTLQWARNLPGAFRDARRLAVDMRNDIYVAGTMWLTNSVGNTTRDSVLIKYSPAGDELWRSVFDNSSAVDEPYSLAISADATRIAIAGISGNLFMALASSR